jgi:hypothetical protein
MSKLLTFGKAALRIYACHLLVFTIGTVCGAVEAFGILRVLWGTCR